MRVLWAGAIVATLTVSIIISIALWGWIGLVIVSVVIAAGALWFFISSTRSTPSLRATSGGGSSRDVLQTWSGLAAIGSGILAVSAVVTMWLPELRGVAYLVVFSSLFGLSILLLAIALPGLRTRQAGLVRRPGRAGFILAMIGVVPFSAFIAFLGISGVLPAAAFSAVGG